MVLLVSSGVLGMRSSNWWFLAGLLVVVDQLVKYFTVVHAPRGRWLFYVQNTGATFGLFPEANSFLAAFSVLALGALGWLLVRSSSWWDSFGLSLVFAGVAGNFLDRLFRGFVVDMFRVGSFPVFNVADVLIVSGVVLLLVLELPVVRRLVSRSD